MGKVCRYGQAEILSDSDWERLYGSLTQSSHRLIISILRYTGERVGAVIALKVEDCYANPFDSIPKETITFRSITRKASPDGTRQTRQVKIPRALKSELSSYQPLMYGWLFPSPRNPTKHISRQNCDDWLRRTCKKLNWQHRGISLHSGRRTAISRMSNAGIPVPAIQRITGHKSVAAVQRYIDVDPNLVDRALELL